MTLLGLLVLNILIGLYGTQCVLFQVETTENGSSPYVRGTTSSVKTTLQTGKDSATVSTPAVVSDSITTQKTTILEINVTLTETRPTPTKSTPSTSTVVSSKPTTITLPTSTNSTSAQTQAKDITSQPGFIAGVVIAPVALLAIIAFSVYHYRRTKYGTKTKMVEGIPVTDL